MFHVNYELLGIFGDWKSNDIEAVPGFLERNRSPGSGSGNCLVLMVPGAFADGWGFSAEMTATWLRTSH